MPRRLRASGTDEASALRVLRADEQGVVVAPGQIMDWPGVSDAVRSAPEARAMFHHTLARWASDVLRLKRRGLDRPTLTQPCEGRSPATPGLSQRRRV